MRRLMLSAVAAAALLAGCGGDDEEPTEEPRTAAQEERAPRNDAAALAAEWWKWAGRRRDGRDPVTDRTGRRCAQDQPDDVWFLAGTFGGRARRTCTVPAGRPIFLPILNQTCPVDSDPELTARQCRADFEGAKARLTVDGREAPVEFVESPPFQHDPHPESVAGVPGESVAVGHHALLDPLPEGEHVVRFSGRREGFSLSVRYDLTIR